MRMADDDLIETVDAEPMLALDTPLVGIILESSARPLAERDRYRCLPLPRGCTTIGLHAFESASPVERARCQWAPNSSRQARRSLARS